MLRANGTRPRKGGRPRKFTEPSRVVTLTLPERTLELLGRVDEDRARAIVHAVDTMGIAPEPAPEVELINVAPGIALVAVPDNDILACLPGIRTIRVAPNKHLLTIDPGTPVEKVEVALIDKAERGDVSSPRDMRLLESLRREIGKLRRSARLSKAELLFVAVD